MSEYRIAKLESLLARVLERKHEPRAVAAVAIVEPATSSVPATQLERAHAAATTPPPPPVAVPAVSIPRQPVPAVTEASHANADDIQESTHVSRSSGPALVPSAAESHARIATAPRTGPADDVHPTAPDLEDERAPVSSERTVDPSYEADPDSAKAPPESTRQLATNPPPQSAPPRISAAPPSLAPESAPRSVSNPVITRGSLPPDANDAVEFRGELPVNKARVVGDLLDATLLL